ncbi:DNA replication factor Cdt1 isoform X2 [Ochlerotatus camptorhynchus]|uniref:DNA replication factor Cdt1 isoform X2 n=1 Tax=Ochlerotatus camptorhynchus TaxID=644619 RepID=UPI0031D5E089
MSQPTVAAYFNTRKRVAADELNATTRNKNVIADGSESCSVGTPERKKITRATRSIKRIGAVKVNEKTKEMLEQPKLVRFLKMGTLSPKKACTAPKQANTPSKAEFSAKNNTSNVERGLHTPTKQEPSTVNPGRASNPSVVSKLTMEETKGKLSRSVRLAELKTSLNKLQSGFDRLDRLQKTRQEDNWKPPVPPSPTTAARNLKQFEKFEVEVPVSPQKPFASPIKTQHRTPTKANHSSLMSPRKQLTPKRLTSLMSPIKEPTATPVTASPTKVPAYQRFQTLVESGTPSLLLPYKYRSLAELFKCIDTVCAMYYNRKEQVTFKKLKPAVQRMARKNLYETHLAQIKTLFPDAFDFRQELTKNYGSATKHETYQLVIKPNVEEKELPKSLDEDANLIRNAQNHSMNPQVMIERFQKFNRILLARTKEAHEKFLLQLDPPVIIPKHKLNRWHPEFNLESCPDVELGEIAQPPNVERFSSAKDVLSTARNLFNCGTAMDRALERLEVKKRENAAAQGTITATNQTPSSANSQEDTTKKKTENPFQSALKNVPQSLLDKIRAKQAAKALDQMTRRPSQEKEAIQYSRLPEIARHLRNVFVTEKKNVLPLETTLLKIENSYRGRLSIKELEEHLKLIVEIAPCWLSLAEARKTMYVKIVKDCDLTKVIDLLEKRASDKLKC